MTFLMSSGGRFWASSVKSTVAKAVLPSRLICGGNAATGFSGSLSQGPSLRPPNPAVATLASISLMRAWVAGP